MSGRPSCKSAFSALFALFRRVCRAPGKSRKQREKGLFFHRYPQIYLSPHLRDFPEEPQGPLHPDPPLQLRPSRTLRPDLIRTRFRPDLDLKRVISGPNQVDIRSKSGLGGGVQQAVPEGGRSGWEGPCSSSEFPSLKPPIYGTPSSS